jgi:hypothetical protein
MKCKSCKLTQDFEKERAKIGFIITCNKKETSAILNPWEYGVIATFKEIKMKINFKG